MATEGDPVKVEGGHVSVTTISMSGPETSNGQFSYSSSGVRISVSSVPQDEDSTDAEISKIDFSQHQYEVNMRNKKKRSSSGACPEAQGLEERERPMSWEGELSDSEMVIDTSVSNDENSNSADLQSSRDSIDTLRNVCIKTEPLKSEPYQSLEESALDLQRPAPLQLHQRSLSMNRISVATDSSPQPSRRPASPGPRTLSYAEQKVPVIIPPPNEAHNLTIKKEAGSSELKCEPTSLPMEKLMGSLHGSPLLGRLPRVLSSASTDSAVHSMYTHSVYSSPSASPRASRHYTPSLSRNNSDASHSSCYSYSSEFSPAHSPVQSRHPHGVVYREAGGAPVFPTSPPHDDDPDPADDRLHHHQGISRQQLINSPCPICGDKISGFHYGIFSCESCKGFFKRTVQNRKNYMCLRGGNCPVTVATRKKCPACRFDKCLGCGMKLEAIREDRTRGGRSTYQCSYSLSGAASTGSLLAAHAHAAGATLRHASSLNSVNGPGSYRGESSHSRSTPDIPPLLQEIMDVEHLWQYNESEISRLGTKSGGSPSTNPLLAASGITAQNSSPDFLADLCNIADHRLYKIVKWCKSLPLFKNISIDDQICLLINSWCELLVLSCCYRGVNTPGEVRVGGPRGLTLDQSAKLGLTPCIERMLSFTNHLRRLRVDRYEYVALKVIVLLTSDTSELREAEKVRASQEKALAALQAYTAARSPHAPSKFGELLLRIPELQKTCQFFMQVGKEMLNPANKNKDGDGPSFNLLMELLRGNGQTILPSSSEVDPELSAGKFQGDIVLDDSQIQDMLASFAQGRNAYTWPNTKWPDNVVVWDFAPGEFGPIQMAAIIEGIRDIERHTCVRFRNRLPEDTTYVLLTGYSDGCYANVGYSATRGVHTLNLARNSLGVGCFRHPTIVHEWMHILGFLHMHSTHDRDDWVDIVEDNVIPASMHNFDIYSSDLVDNLGIDYDYISCLHYGPFAFTINGDATIVAKQEHEGTMGQRIFITDSDWLRINRHYNCPGAWD